MACSFTKAAAVELATKEVDGQKSDIPKQMIGTLHSLCYRALDCPPLAEAFIGDFNDRHPEYRLTETTRPDVDDLGAAESSGVDGQSADALLSSYQLLRARSAPHDAWPLTVLGFAAKWEAWKDSRGALDFTDLIEHAPPAPPGAPKALFVDEAQDLDTLQFALARKWGAHVDSLVFLADDDQQLYSWRGADIANLVDAPVPAENRIVLKQSHRIPRAVHAYSQRWIEQVQHRQKKEFLPRVDKAGAIVEGRVRTSEASVRFPEGEIDTIRRLTDDGKTVMVLATCGYMLRGWIAALREAGLPFHNPYRVNRSDWSPLSRKEGGAAARLSSFLAAEDGRIHWTMYNLHQFVPMLRADGILKRGAKAEIEQLAEDRPGYRPQMQELGRWFEGSALELFHVQQPWPPAGALDWLVDHTLPARAGPLRYAASIARKALLEHRDARQALSEPARVIVGTVHSVKGGQADVVMLAPDLSPQAAEQQHRSAAGRDEIRRTMYVGMTRAAEELVLLRPGSRMSVEL